MFAIGGMLSSKVFEIKVRKINFLATLWMKGDEKIHQFIATTLLKYDHYKKIAHIFVFEFLPSFLYENIIKLKDYISKKYYAAATEGFRGRRVLRTNGSVSFFLERLAETKAKNQ